MLMLTLKYLHRHPAECAGLPADALFDLIAYHEALVKAEEGR